MRGIKLNVYQEAEALIEFNKLLDFYEKALNTELLLNAPSDEEIMKAFVAGYYEGAEATLMFPTIAYAKWMRNKIKEDKS